MARTYCAFLGDRRIASGSLEQVVAALEGQGAPLTSAIVFDDATGKPLRLNTREDLEQAFAAGHGGPGVPVSVEIRLLPRHRDWLERQQGGASGAVRRLVDAARRDPVYRAQDARQAAYCFVSMLAGDFVGYEEACRALFAGDLDGFSAAAAAWPADIREHGLRLAEAA